MLSRLGVHSAPITVHNALTGSLLDGDLKLGKEKIRSRHVMTLKVLRVVGGDSGWFIRYSMVRQTIISASVIEDKPKEPGCHSVKEGESIKPKSQVIHISELGLAGIRTIPVTLENNILKQAPVSVRFELPGP
jgi:hypothetical protein